MKTVSAFAVMLACLWGTTTVTAGTLSAEEEAISSKVLKYAEENLSTTLGKYNDDYKLSSVEVIYDLKRLYPEMSFKKAVIPMMRILRGHKDQNVRAMAAILLQQIGDGRGTWAVKEAARFDGSKLVRHVCSTLACEKH